MMTSELASKVNGYLANIGVSYIKLHNLHWNVQGHAFKPVHEYLESLYEALAGVLDEVAELLKMDDKAPLASMKEYLAAATISELESVGIRNKEALRIVLADLEHLKAQAEELRKGAIAEDHYALQSMIEGHLGHYAKNIWFIRSMMK